MNPDGSKSRSGYLIMIDDCPVSWHSKSQGETALSTTEAEYIALSLAMRELLWTRRLVADVKAHRVARIHSKVFEDNQAAIAVALKPDLTARTRHLHTKYHHFKEHIGLDESGHGITLHYCPTDKQIADLLTKGLGDTDFIPLRNRLMGWLD